MKKILITLSILFIGSSLFADTYFRNRTITGISIYYAENRSVLFLTIDGDVSAMNDKCVHANRFAIDSTMPHFKEIVSVALSAYVSKEKTVDIYARDNCIFWGDAQDLIAIKVGNMAF